MPGSLIFQGPVPVSGSLCNFVPRSLPISLVQHLSNCAVVTDLKSVALSHPPLYPQLIDLGSGFCIPIPSAVPAELISVNVCCLQTELNEARI